MRMNRPRRSRLTHAPALVGPATTVVLCILSLLAPPAAMAHPDPTIAVVLTGVTPKLPKGVALELVDGHTTHAALSNANDEPVLVLDPKGRPFLQVSADGVYGDIESSYLGALPRNDGADATIDLECCPDGTWVRLHTASVWMWGDPRLDPPLRAPTADDARGLGQLASDEPLAEWQFDLRQGGATYTAEGVLKRRPAGEVTTKIDHAPPGVSATVIESRPPQVRIEVDDGTEVEVLDDDGRKFLQVSRRGGFGRVTSEAFQGHLRAMGLRPQVGGEAWQPLAGSGPNKATWVDPRLDYRTKIPSDPAKIEDGVINEWRIPVLVNGEPSEITGQSEWKLATPPPLPRDEKSPGFWAGGNAATYLVAGGLTFAVLGAYVVARIRRKEEP